MKILSLFLCLCFLENAFAQTSSLETLIDEHQYFLTVEYDQKDKYRFPLDGHHLNFTLGHHHG